MRCLHVLMSLLVSLSNNYTQLGTLIEKIEIEEKQIKHSTPEPIIEEPLSPNIQRGHSDILEGSEFIENDQAEKVQHFKEEELPKVKSKRAKSIQIEEIQENEPDSHEPKTPVETEIPKRRASKAQAATIEEIVESQIEETPKEIKESKIDRQESQKGVKNYTEEDDEEIEALLKRAQKQRSLVEDLPKSQVAEGTLLHKITISCTHCINLYLVALLTSFC